MVISCFSASDYTGIFIRAFVFTVSILISNREFFSFNVYSIHFHFKKDLISHLKNKSVEPLLYFYIFSFKTKYRHDFTGSSKENVSIFSGFFAVENDGYTRFGRLIRNGLQPAKMTIRMTFLP